MDNNIKIVGNEDKPDNWLANAKEFILEKAIYAAEDFGGATLVPDPWY